MRNSDKILEFSTQTHNPYCYSQKGENTCGLAAFKIASNFFKMDLSEKEMIGILSRKKLPFSEAGVFSSHIGILGIECNLSVQIHTSDIFLRKLLTKLKDINKLKSSKIICKDSQLQNYLDSYKTFLNLNGKLIIYTKKNKLTFKKIKNSINNSRKFIAIARVTSSEYYRTSKENWGHYLVIISPKDNQFCVIDCYGKKGKKLYKEKWNSYLKNAEKFNWSNWSDDLIILSTFY
jgi:hypothetical protein